MEPVLMILIPGVVGGLVLALLIARKWRKSSSVVVPRRVEAPSPALDDATHHGGKSGVRWGS